MRCTSTASRCVGDDDSAWKVNRDSSRSPGVRNRRRLSTRRVGGMHWKAGNATATNINARHVRSSHGTSIVATRCRQTWTLSVINWRPSPVSYVDNTCGGRRLVYHAKSSTPVYSTIPSRGLTHLRRQISHSCWLSLFVVNLLYNFSVRVLCSVTLCCKLEVSISTCFEDMKSL